MICVFGRFAYAANNRTGVFDNISNVNFVYISFNFEKLKVDNALTAYFYLIYSGAKMLRLQFKNSRYKNNMNSNALSGFVLLCQRKPRDSR